MRIIALACLLALPAFARSEVRDQGMVKSHLWTSTAGLENARTSLRALTALANDATAWDQRHALDLLHEAQDGIAFARTHARHLRMFQGANKDAAQDLAKLTGDLDSARALLSGVERPVSRGVSPKRAATRDDQTMLGGAAADRGLPPGPGGDVTTASNRGQRGGTPEMRSLRDFLKKAWDQLDDARGDLDRLAGDLNATTKLPNP